MEPGTTSSSLLQGLRERRRDALDELAAQYGAALSRAAWAFLGDRHTAEDVVQETLIAAWDGAKRARASAGLRPWLFGILFNRCRKHRRAAARRRRREEERTPMPAGQGPAAETLSAIRAALDRLEEDRRAVVVARYMEGMSVAETAEALGIPEGTVKSRNHAALAELKRLLGGRHAFV